MSNTILVTGGAGYIGSHTCKLLSKCGYTPIVYDNMSTGNNWAVKWGPLEIGDVNDFYKAQLVIKKYNPKAVIHFAGSAYVGESIQNPEKYYYNNVSGTLTLLKAMHHSGVHNIIFSSSCATYGIPESVPIHEHFQQNPINPYGSSKLMAERIIYDFKSAYDMNFSILRYFNAAGASEEGDIGELHKPEPHLIPRLLQAAAGEISNITIYGDDYETPDGTCIRDYVHVNDLASAHVAALDRMLKGGEPITCNLGSSQGFSIRQLLQEVERVTKSKVPIKIGHRRQGDPPILIGDATLAKKLLGWSAVENDLERIIATADAWRKIASENLR